ncbi:hypothetical protein [Fuerstiella marisgermanici]|uniref:hypothetical protein n=1 Tax=Fuerstiella marisgermanici TaxID=1891926 RepID=UPI0011AB48ED|nr:hypothetical protein [Fuerstiella marisgermanici]
MTNAARRVIHASHGSAIADLIYQTGKRTACESKAQPTWPTLSSIITLNVCDVPNRRGKHRMCVAAFVPEVLTVRSR